MGSYLLSILPTVGEHVSMTDMERKNYKNTGEGNVLTQKFIRRKSSSKLQRLYIFKNESYELLKQLCSFTVKYKRM